MFRCSTNVVSSSLYTYTQLYIQTDQHSNTYSHLCIQNVTFTNSIMSLIVNYYLYNKSNDKYYLSLIYVNNSNLMVIFKHSLQIATHMSVRIKSIHCGNRNYIHDYIEILYKSCLFNPLLSFIYELGFKLKLSIIFIFICVCVCVYTVFINMAYFTLSTFDVIADTM